MISAPPGNPSGPSPLLVFMSCLLSSCPLRRGREKNVKLVQERGVGRGRKVLALFVVCDVLDDLQYGSGVVFPEVVLHLLFVFCFSSPDASVQVCSGNSFSLSPDLSPELLAMSSTLTLVPKQGFWL